MHKIILWINCEIPIRLWQVMKIASFGKMRMPIWLIIWGSDALHRKYVRK